ncbi:hypothetical protein [Anaerotruncus rubiinfantis]|uniref:hypothetical protein n=1 Tax=Anaerotruncus rubiinfantis TaxID=1720200 RepID=UPI0034A1867D
MKRPTAFLFCFILCSVLFLTACQNKAASLPRASQSAVEHSSAAQEIPSGSAESFEEENPPASAPEDASSSAPDISAAGMGSSIADSLSESVITSAGSDSELDSEPDTVVTVQKLNMTETQELIVKDEAQIEQIIAFIDSMFESGYSAPPATGGTVITVSITRDCATADYTFLEQEVDGYRLAKNLQHADVQNTWYFADPEAYPYFLSLFPL